MLLNCSPALRPVPLSVSCNPAAPLDSAVAAASAGHGPPVLRWKREVGGPLAYDPLCIAQIFVLSLGLRLISILVQAIVGDISQCHGLPSLHPLSGPRRLSSQTLPSGGAPLICAHSRTSPALASDASAIVTAAALAVHYTSACRPRAPHLIHEASVALSRAWKLSPNRCSADGTAGPASDSRG